MWGWGEGNGREMRRERGEGNEGRGWGLDRRRGQKYQGEDSAQILRGLFPNSSRQIHGSMNLTTAEIETTSSEPLT